MPSSQVIPQAVSGADWSIPMPPAGGTIAGDRSGTLSLEYPSGTIALSLDDPTRLGLTLVISMGADNGVVTITADSGVNQAGNVEMPFTDVGDTVMLVSIRDTTTTYAWRIMGNDTITPADP